MWLKKLSCFLLLICVSSAAIAQGDTSANSVESMAKKRQDPVSGLRSIFLQEVLLPIGEGTASSFSIQPVYPFKLAHNLKLITYTIIPIQTVPPLTIDGSKEGGLGNILFNGYFSSIEKAGKFSWGIGPTIQIPTRTNATLGSNRVCLGPTGLLYYAGEKISLGAVLQNYWSIGGSGVNKVNSFSAQYIFYYNLPKAWYLQSNATIIANWMNDSDKWLIPLGGGPGKTFQIGERFYCVAAQMFYNVAKPLYVGKWQVILQFQIIL